ncbi:MAG TPA: pyridoxal-phosphate dependent enzyme [Candidatus Paceibacterota bacterium]|nr:pyridoxal-phosphate dependent enzyme [Candidatus Paceibacterota bacterium]
MSRAQEIAYALNHPIAQALHPGKAEFVTRRELSPKLNPGAAYGLRVSALIMFGRLPHIKAIPALQMLREDYEAGKYVGVHTLVVPSSGNTAHAAARLAPAFGFKHVKVVLASDVPESKRGIISALASTTIISPEGGKSVEQEARELAQLPGHYLLDQYNHHGNYRSHLLFTGPAIWNACDRDLEYIAIGMGSAGTLIGVSRALKRTNTKRVQVIGVRPLPGERVPGVRDAARMESVLNPEFRRMAADAADHLVEVGRKESFIAMRELWSEVEPQPAPSGALACVGLRKWIASLSAKEKEKLAGRHAAFICPDDGRFYSERIEGELDPDQGLVH